jgi:anti-anti-sigma factor
MNVKLDIEKRTLTLRVAGDLLSTTVETVRKDFDGWLEISERAAEWSTFKLDLTAAKMVDASGLYLIVSLLKQVQQRGAVMQVAYSSPNVLRTFVFGHVERHVEMVKVSTPCPATENGATPDPNPFPEEFTFR